MPSTANRLRTRASLVLAAFAFVLAALAVYDAPADDQAAQECLSGWSTAPASSTCDITVYSSGGGECGIAASCPADDGTTEFTSISLEPGQFPQLRNCNGVLTVSQSSC